jgi:hypothetical protein
MKPKPARSAGTKPRLMIYLTPELERTLRYAAFLERTSASAVAARALADYFKEHAIEVPAEARKAGRL